MAKWASDKKKNVPVQTVAPGLPTPTLAHEYGYEYEAFPSPADSFFAECQTITLKALGSCVFCPRKFDKETEFRDDIARREYSISTVCQRCQDLTFAE